MKELICNKAKCTKCGDVIISHSRHDYVTCSCRSISTDGGNSYLHRSGIEWLEDQSVYADDDWETVRQNLYRGTFDKDGNRIWLKLSELTNDHLLALMPYCISRGYETTTHFKFYKKEIEFRGLDG